MQYIFSSNLSISECIHFLFTQHYTTTYLYFMIFLNTKEMKLENILDIFKILFCHLYSLHDFPSASIIVPLPYTSWYFLNTKEIKLKKILNTLIFLFCHRYILHYSPISFHYHVLSSIMIFSPSAWYFRFNLYYLVKHQFFKLLEEHKGKTQKGK